MLFTQSLLALTGAATATNLWIADYSGIITTAELTERNGNYSLAETSINDECGADPSWLTADTNRGLMFCLNEAIAGGNGTVVSYTINDDASLNLAKSQDTLNGPVSGAIYGHAAGQRGLVAAHYGGSGVTTYPLNGGGTFELHETFTYEGKGPKPQQDSPHPHEAVLDPTGQYILVPDLGADLVRVYSWDAKTLKLTALETLKASPGYGPRHLAFHNPKGVARAGYPTQMYLVGELAGMVTGFNVSYKDAGEGLTFENTTASVLQPDNPANAPAEIEITPDGRFMIVSNRDAGGQDAATSTKSSLATYCLHEDGHLEEPELMTNEQIGTGYPRHFSLNKDGSLMAVGLQFLNKTIVLERDVKTGKIGTEVLADLVSPGPVTNVMWAA